MNHGCVWNITNGILYFVFGISTPANLHLKPLKHGLKMVVSIHQPNFFPHYPFFEKMKEADIFVLLTHCQFEKNNYQNRFRMEDRWHTLCVNSGLQSMREKKYLRPFDDWSRIKQNLKPWGFILDKFDDCISNDLVKTNISIIKRIVSMLNIKTIIEIDDETKLKGTERLLDICKKYNAHKYISGVSGVNYMDMELFERNDIEVVFQPLQKTKPII